METTTIPESHMAQYLIRKNILFFEDCGLHACLCDSIERAGGARRRNKGLVLPINFMAQLHPELQHAELTILN